MSRTISLTVTADHVRESVRRLNEIHIIKAGDYEKHSIFAVALEEAGHKNVAISHGFFFADDAQWYMALGAALLDGNFDRLVGQTRLSFIRTGDQQLIDKLVEEFIEGRLFPRSYVFKELTQ